MKKILIVTGGSGGHVIPAISIYDHLINSFSTSIVSDFRGSKFINKKKYNLDLIDIPNLFSKWYLLPLNIIKFLISIFKSYNYLKKNKINILISTGGYMSLPLCISARILKICIILFEPNSVLGRANKIMLNISHQIICYDKDLKLFPQKNKKKIYLINPILRKEIYSYKKKVDENFSDIKKIIILGGSQSAKFFDNNITNLILSISKKFKLEVCQQIFDNNEKYAIENKYNNSGIKHRLFKYDENLLRKINNYDLAITRSGAMAISELAYLNIPFVSIPYPFAKDDHQYYNAKFYETRDCCWLVRQNDFDLSKIENLIVKLFTEKTDYLKKKENLKKISNQNTWNNVNKKLIDLINEN
tara:strand:+ start:275 stop:1351 length:1077 start_codon:yes stop_codon:yes gene_type:complete